MYRESEIRRLTTAVGEGRDILNRFPDDSGYMKWTMTTERLLREVFGPTQLWSNFLRGYQGRVVMQAPPTYVHEELQRRKVAYHVEAVEAALEWAYIQVQDGPVPRDPLIEARQIAVALNLSSVASYLDDAVRAYGRAEWEQAVGRAGHAFERAVHALSELASGERRGRDLAGALGTLTSRGVITEETRNALAARNVGLWGWISIKGRHAEGVAEGTPANEPTEARYALDWVGSAIAFLGSAYQASLQD